MVTNRRYSTFQYGTSSRRKGGRMSLKPIRWRNLRTTRVMSSTRRLMKTLSDKAFSRHASLFFTSCSRKRNQRK